MRDGITFMDDRLLSLLSLENNSTSCFARIESLPGVFSSCSHEWHLWYWYSAIVPYGEDNKALS